MSVLSEDGRRALLAVYADIDAEGGDDPAEGVDFNRGFRVGLELALVKIDQTLNEAADPDEAWVSEGLARLRSATRASPETRPDVEGLVEHAEYVAQHFDRDAAIAARDLNFSSSGRQKLAERHAKTVRDLASALSAYETRVQELTRQVENACTRIVRAHHRTDAAEARASAAEKDAARLRETLGQISRMRTMPDDKMNTFTLGTAHRLALTALEQKPEGEG